MPHSKGIRADNISQETLKHYYGVQNTRCARCNNLVDDELDYPLIRLPESRKDSDGNAQTIWGAYHATCLAK